MRLFHIHFNNLYYQFDVRLFYPVYGAGARAAGCELIFLPTTLANGFLPDLDAIRGAITENTKAVVVNSPNNPTGESTPAEWVRALTDARRPAGPLVVIDEAYADFAEDTMIPLAAIPMPHTRRLRMPC